MLLQSSVATPTKIGVGIGRKADGNPWRLDRASQPSTTACLAWCETWFRP